MTHYTECDRILSTFRFSGPACFDNTVSETFAHLSRIGAVVAVNLDPPGYSDKSEYVVSIYGVATFGQLEVQSFQVLVNDEYILFSDSGFVYLVWQVVFFGTAVDHFITFTVPFLLFDVFIQNVVHVKHFVGNILIKLCHILESQAFDQTHHYCFVIFHLPVFEFPFQCFFGEIVLACYHFLQGLADLRTGF